MTHAPDTPRAPRPTFPDFDPLEPAQLADPHPVVARARREAPVFFAPDYGMWVVTRYEDVLAVIKDTATFSNSGADAVVAPIPAEVSHLLPDGHPVSKSLHTTDPPVHTRLRKLAQKAFTPGKARAREQEIAEVARGLIAGFEDRDEIDLVAEYSSQIPSRVIARVVGAPDEAAARLKQWTDEWFALGGNSRLPAERNAELWRSAAEFEAFVAELVRERRAEPRDDLVSDLIRATADDGSPSLSDWEIVCVVAGVIAAGADTTNGLIAHSIDLLLTHLDRWEAVRRDPTLIANVIEEALRVRCPVRGQRRVTTRECRLAGVTIPEGAVAFIHAASANRDEAVFERPDEFDLHRPNVAAHLGLGVGTHFCLGAPLARTETRIAIEALVDRFPGMRLVPGQRLEWAPSTYVPALLGLRVTLR